MKKALIVLLLLAFVAGGLFAQEGLSFSGRVMAGLGMWKVGDNDAGWGVMTPSGTTRGIRWNFIASYENADGNKGFYTYFRSRGAPNSNRKFQDASGTGSFEVLYAEGWFTAFDGLLKIQGGKMTDSPFGYGDWWGEDDPSDTAFGLMATINATDSIKIGVGSKSSYGIDQMEKFEDSFGGFFGVRAGFGPVDARAYFDYAKDYITVHAAATIEAGDFEVGLPVYVWDLGNFSDSGELQFLPYVSFSGIENVGIDLFGMVGIDGAGGDPAFGAMLGVQYSFGNIIPRLAIAYMSGATYCGPAYGLRECIWDFNSYDKGDSYLLIRPQLRCRTSSSSYVDFAFVVAPMLGDNKPSNSLQIGGLIDFSVSF